jgi:hypothetical protein
MAGLIPNCSGVLALAGRRKAANEPVLREAAQNMVRNSYDSAIAERQRWRDAADGVEELVRQFGPNPQVKELVDGLREVAGQWNDCAREFASFLESLGAS